MVIESDAALRAAGYDTSALQVLIRADLPSGYRAMTLDDGAVLGVDAFSSQDMLNHVLEEELLHLRQKAEGRASVFEAGTAAALEEEIDAIRRFPRPAS